MASWILPPCLVSLRGEFNALSPGRDKASDGSIGDAAHAGSSSDHNPDETGATPYEDADSINEVHAIDVDKDLRRVGWSMDRAVEIIIKRHRSGRDDRLQNVIFDRRIYSASWGWTARTYTGSNPHDKHAHFSARYTTAQERDTSPWGLLEADAPAREVEYVEISGNYPLLKLNDSDDKLPGGTAWIARSQHMLNYLVNAELTVDGDYGAKTATALKKLMAGDPERTTANGSEIGKAEWRRLLAAWA